MKKMDEGTFSWAIIMGLAGVTIGGAWFFAWLTW